LLSGAAALAAPVVAVPEELALTTAAGAGPHGMYWLTVNLADRTPVVLAVDDVHWVDPGRQPGPGRAAGQGCGRGGRSAGCRR
jgi:hypothetical protein